MKSIQSSKKDLRNFGLSVGFVSMGIAGVLLWKGSGAFPYIFTAGLVLVGCGTVVPIVLKPFYRVWMGFASIIGWIMTRLILCLLFYLVISPMAIISKLIGKRYIDLKWDEKQPTYWHDLKLTESTREEYKRQF